MIAELTKVRSFHRHQQVGFIGGEGIIRSFKYENGTWKYLVEMPLDIPIPTFGRIGAETIVLLDEVELNIIGN
jgi:hypothetical protein